MNEVWSWIAENYKLLVLIVACCLDIGLFLVGVFRKKRNISLEEMLLRIPHLVSMAEDLIGKGQGEVKKKKVMDILVGMYKEDTGVEVLPGSSVYVAFENYIEKVLETPHKKG